MADEVAIIRTGPVEQAVEGKPIMRDVDRLARLERGDALAAPCGHGDDAEQA